MDRFGCQRRPIRGAEAARVCSNTDSLRAMTKGSIRDEHTIDVCVNDLPELLNRTSVFQPLQVGTDVLVRIHTQTRFCSKPYWNADARIGKTQSSGSN